MFIGSCTVLAIYETVFKRFCQFLLLQRLRLSRNNLLCTYAVALDSDFREDATARNFI